MEETKKCPYCGEEILATAKKCKYCGEWLPEQTETKATEPQERKMMACPVCAEQIEVGTKVCPYCHEALVTEERPVNAVTEKGETISPTPPSTSPRIEKPSTAAPVGNEMPTGHLRGFFDYYFVDVFFRHYADFNGKISRKQFWMGYLCYALLMGVLSCLDMLIGSPFIIMIIASLALVVPGIAFVGRRLHDIGKSGWWILIYLVPLVGPIWWLVLLCKKGETVCEPVKHNAKDFIVWGIGIAIIIALSIKLVTLDDSSYGDCQLSYPNETETYEEEELNVNDSDSSNNEESIIVAEPIESGTFSGYIDGKYAVTFELMATDINKTGSQIVNGSYYYDKNGEENSISIDGYYDLESETLELTEYYEDGTPNSTISAVKVPQGFRGTFTTPEGKEMDFFIAPQ